MHSFSLRPYFCLPSSVVCSPALGFCPECKPLFQRRTEGIPTSLLQKEPRPFKALPLALRTRQLVGFRSLATQVVASTLLPARGPCFSTLQTPIRRLARRRFYSTPPASTTPLLERPRF